MNGRVLFWKQAAKEYGKLDVSLQEWVGAALRRLEQRGPVIGEVLACSHYPQLAGFQQLKNEKLGISLIYCAAQSGEVEIISIMNGGRQYGL